MRVEQISICFPAKQRRRLDLHVCGNGNRLGLFDFRLFYCLLAVVSGQSPIGPIKDKVKVMPWSPTACHFSDIMTEASPFI